MPLVSVLMPVRDAAATLDAALDSVLASRDVDLEVLCVDDGSRDGSRERLEARSRADARVRVIARGRDGICRALATGLAQTRGALVARMDADDRMHPERLKRQRELLERRPDLDLIGCGVECERAGGLGGGWQRWQRWANALVEHDAIAREAFVDCPLPHPTWMFRRERVLALGGYRDVDWPEDLDLLYRLLGAGGRVGKVAQPLHTWLDRDDRLSRTDARYDRRAMARVKAHYLPGVIGVDSAVIWGAGRTGRRMARLLAEAGVRVRALVDVHPRHVGGRWQGLPILSPEGLRESFAELHASGACVIGAVARLGARDHIRDFLRALGAAEGRDFVMTS